MTITGPRAIVTQKVTVTPRATVTLSLTVTKSVKKTDLNVTTVTVHVGMKIETDHGKMMTAIEIGTERGTSLGVIGIKRSRGKGIEMKSVVIGGTRKSRVENVTITVSRGVGKMIRKSEKDEKDSKKDKPLAESSIKDIG